MEKFIEAKYCGKDFLFDLQDIQEKLSSGRPSARRPSGAERICSGLLRIKLLRGLKKEKMPSNFA